jgi:glycosyltransferase involved in cell wall biosynthesis
LGLFVQRRFAEALNPQRFCEASLIVARKVRIMRVAHLTASPFFGGPERQMLGLARSLPSEVASVFLSFPERGLCQPFLHELHRHGFAAEALVHNVPHVASALRELRGKLRRHRIDLLCCHGYKADLLGLRAARSLGMPVVSVSRGWTAATWKVRFYEACDRVALRWMDRVVCVSEGQARKVRAAGVPDHKLRVIRNAIETDRFGEPDEPGRAFLNSFFPRPRKYIIGAAGRFSPEKGYRHLVDAAAEVARTQPEAGFLLFGSGPLERALARQIDRLGLRGRFVLAGFRADLDRWLPNFDLFVLPSYTEGLPNVVLEACAARVSVVATAVGGTPEVIADGETGYLVPAGQTPPLARRISELLADDRLRETLATSGYFRVRDQFTFEVQARQYLRLFAEFVETRHPVLAPPHRSATKTVDTVSARRESSER